VLILYVLIKKQLIPNKNCIFLKIYERRIFVVIFRKIKCAVFGKNYSRLNEFYISLLVVIIFIQNFNDDKIPIKKLKKLLDTNFTPHMVLRWKINKLKHLNVVWFWKTCNQTAVIRTFITKIITGKRKLKKKTKSLARFKFPKTGFTTNLSCIHWGVINIHIFQEFLIN
jgi:hypothetical protein